MPKTEEFRSPVIVWFRRDLRISDHPALSEALKEGPVIPLYIESSSEEGDWTAGSASKWWLHQSLAKLSGELALKGSRLILRRGNAAKILEELAKESGAKTVLCSRSYDARILKRDEGVKKKLAAAGVEIRGFNGSLLREPWETRTGSGGPYKVFTPFWKNYLSGKEFRTPLAEPSKIEAPGKWPASDKLADWGLEPKINWAGGMKAFWEPGEKGAARALETFLPKTPDYPRSRDMPSEEGTSMLSPHLHFGEISVHQVWDRVQRLKCKTKEEKEGQETFLKELVWREFSYHLLFHFPHTPEEPLYEQFRDFPWNTDYGELEAWQKGRTGYPIVDAGMRQLWHLGWMHNRVRMITGSFLVKDLLLPWQKGAGWFWDTLVDADLAQNTMNWQWVGGCGADAAPFFRIFNPITQSRKFDPEGNYIRKWVPELGNMPARWIHEPWTASAEVLLEAGVRLGDNYPEPVVQHDVARKRALLEYNRFRKR